MSAVLLVLLVAAPDAGPLPLALSPLPFTWELPPKTMHEAPIDGTTWVRGVPVRMRYLMVNDTPLSIGRHFLDSFKRQGLYIQEGQTVDVMLTGVDPRSIITYSVVLQPNSPGHTTVILGEAKPLENKPPAPMGLPVPPSASGVLPVQFEGYTLLSFKVTAPPAQLEAFYALELSQRGYLPKDHTVWVKPGEQLEVTISSEGKETKVVLKQQRR